MNTADDLRDGAARKARGLRYPKLFAAIGLLFLLDLVVPDFIPFVDEIILGLFTVILGMLKERRGLAAKTVEADPH